MIAMKSILEYAPTANKSAAIKKLRKLNSVKKILSDDLWFCLGDLICDSISKHFLNFLWFYSDFCATISSKHYIFSMFYSKAADTVSKVLLHSGKSQCF